MATANEEQVSKGAPWTAEDFDAERAWALVTNLRDNIAKLKDENSALHKEVDTFKSVASEREDAEKSEVEKAVARAEALATDLTKTQRELWAARAQAKHHVPDDLVDFLTGETEDDVFSKAERLAKTNDVKDEPKPGIPQPRLVPGQGADNDAPTFDAESIAAKIRKARE